MTERPKAVADTNPVGRHGRVGYEILPRDIEYPRFDREHVEQAMGIVASSNVTIESLPQGVQKPAEAPGYYL